MSKWTHVNGIIRVDALRMPGMKVIPINIGTPSFWEDDHEAKDIPEGSEGSLNAEIWENPSGSSLAAYTVSIFGDLRDFESADEILAYLNQITDGQMIRSGVCEVTVEYGTTTIFRYDSDASAWETVHTTVKD